MYSILLFNYAQENAELSAIVKYYKPGEFSAIRLSAFEVNVYRADLLPTAKKNI